MDDSEEEDDEPSGLEWEAQAEKLKNPLPQLWNRGKTGPRADMKELLLGIPRFQVLPSEAPRNNHQQDGKSREDRNLRQIQNSLLHLARVLGHAYTQRHDGQPDLQ